MANFLRLNLKARLVAMTVILFIAAIWVLSYLTTASLMADVKKLLAEQQFSSASYVADDIEQRVKLRLNALSIIGSEIDLPLLNEPAKLQDLLAHRPLLRSLFGNGVIVISLDGKPVTAYPPSSFSASLTYSNIEYFQQVIDTGKPAIGKPRIGRVSKKPTIGFAAPILAKDGAVIGVLVGFSLLSDPNLFGVLERAEVGHSGWIAVSAPAYQLIVSSSDPSRILDQTARRGVNAMFDRFVDGWEGSGISVNSKGVETLTSAKQIPGTGWFAQIVLPTKEAFAPIHNMVARTYVIAAGLSLFVAILAWVMIRKMLQPLAETSRQIEEMASGKAPLASIEVNREDEIGALRNGFNHLVLAINEAEARVHAQARHITHLSQRLLAAQEEERRRLALDIHDVVSPNVATIKIQLKMLGSDPNLNGDSQIVPQLEDVRALIEDTEASLRRICADLRPAALDYTGLASALEEYAQQFSTRTGIAVRKRMRDSGERLPNEVEAILFRIAQEALTNCVKHARAAVIEIEWTLDSERSVLVIADDGIGFDSSELASGSRHPGLGLLTMRERAEYIGGQFSIESARGQGTRITIDLMRRD